jgi:hypothetical protein
MIIRLYVDNHKIAAGTPFVLATDDPDVGIVYAAKVTIFGGPVTTEFNPDGERPQCFVLVKGAAKIHMNEKHHALVTFHTRLD